MLEWSAPAVQEDEFEVQTGAEHEHVAVELDLGDAAGRKRLSERHQPHDLIAGLKQRHVHQQLTQLQVTAAVDHLHTADASDSPPQRERECVCV